MHKVCLRPPSVSGRSWGLILNVISPLLPSCWGFSFALGHGVSFFGGTQHSPVDGCSAVSCNFGVLAGEDEHMSFYSAILRGKTLLNSLVIIVLGEKFPKIIKLRRIKHLGFPSDSAVKTPSAMKETKVQSLDQENPLEEGMANHSSILAWRIP